MIYRERMRELGCIVVMPTYNNAGTVGITQSTLYVVFYVQLIWDLACRFQTACFSADKCGRIVECLEPFLLSFF